MQKGDLYWADLDPTVGSEIAKKRPVLLVSNDVNNRFSSTVSVVPITSSTDKIYPFEVLLLAGEGGLKNESKVKANQIRTIDKLRLGNRLLHIQFLGFNLGCSFGHWLLGHNFG